MSTPAAKTCSKCGETKQKNLFPKKGAACRQCLAEIAKEYRKTENHRTARARWTKQNKERIREYSRELYLRRPDKFSEYRKKYKDRANIHNKLRVANISSSYVVHNMIRGTKLRPEQIPDSVIEAKRLQLKLKRLAREAT